MSFKKGPARRHELSGVCQCILRVLPRVVGHGLVVAVLARHERFESLPMMAHGHQPTTRDELAECRPDSVGVSGTGFQPVMGAITGWKPVPPVRLPVLRAPQLRRGAWNSTTG